MILWRRPILSALVLAGLIWGLVGCDLAGSEADLDLLAGSWRVEALSVDGISMKAQLDAQYNLLVLTLRESADGHEFFSMVGREEGRGRTLLVQGSFLLDSSDDELTLLPNDGSQVEFDYAVPDSSRSRLHLRAEEGRSEDRFLELIQFPIQGAVDRLDLRLSNSEPSTQGLAHRAGPGD